MTNGERADRLLEEARRIGVEMRQALEPGGWNLALRRAQEVIELVVKALLSEMSVDYPKSHDPAPVLVTAIRARGLDVDAGFLQWLRALSAKLEEIRSPAFYHEIEVTAPQARAAVGDAERVLEFARDLFTRLRST